MSAGSPSLTRTRTDSETGIKDTCDHKSYAEFQQSRDPANLSEHMASEQDSHGKRKRPAAPQVLAAPLLSRGISSIDNPKPQQSQAPSPANSGTNGDKLVVVMVGLPARGKTYVARKLARYLTFFHGAPAEVFNVGNYRRKISGARVHHSFFAPNNESAQAQRKEAAVQAMSALKSFLKTESGNQVGKVGIYDATNSTRERRQWILDELLEIVNSRLSSLKAYATMRLLLNQIYVL